MTITKGDKIFFWGAWAFILLFVRLFTPSWETFGLIMFVMIFIFAFGAYVGSNHGRRIGYEEAKGIEPPDDPNGNSNIRPNQYL